MLKAELEQTLIKAIHEASHLLADAAEQLPDEWTLTLELRNDSLDIGLGRDNLVLPDPEGWDDRTENLMDGEKIALAINTACWLEEDPLPFGRDDVQPNPNLETRRGKK